LRDPKFTSIIYQFSRSHIKFMKLVKNALKNKQNDKNTEDYINNNGEN